MKASKDGGELAVDRAGDDVEDGDEHEEGAGNERVPERDYDADDAGDRAAQNEFLGDVAVARLHFFIEKMAGAYGVPEMSVEGHADENEIYAIDDDRDALIGIAGQQCGGKGNEGDGAEEGHVDPHGFAVDAADEAKMIVMADPIDAEDREADDVSEEARPHEQQASGELACGGMFRKIWNFDAEDDQSHGDGEDAIGEGFDTVLSESDEFVLFGHCLEQSCGTKSAAARLVSPERDAGGRSVRDFFTF